MRNPRRIFVPSCGPERRSRRFPPNAFPARTENYSSQVLDESVAWTTSDVRHCDWTITRENEIPFREIVQERAIDICSDFFFVSGCLERRIDIFVDITIKLDA